MRHIHNATKGILFERGLIRRFTYAGSKTSYSFSNKQGRKKTIRKYGNYLTDVKKAATVMNEKEILRQLRRCTCKLSKAMKMAKTDIPNSIRSRYISQINKYGKIYD